MSVRKRERGRMLLHHRTHCARSCAWIRFVYNLMCRQRGPGLSMAPVCMCERTKVCICTRGAESFCRFASDCLQWIRLNGTQLVPPHANKMANNKFNTFTGVARTHCAQRATTTRHCIVARYGTHEIDVCELISFARHEEKSCSYPSRLC